MTSPEMELKLGSIRWYAEEFSLSPQELEMIFVAGMIACVQSGQIARSRFASKEITRPSVLAETPDHCKHTGTSPDLRSGIDVPKSTPHTS